MKLPWWAGVSAAVVLFLVLNSLANMDIGLPQKVGPTGDFILKQVVKAAASVLRYVIPAVLLVGAIVSGIQQWRRARDLGVSAQQESEPFSWGEARPVDEADSARRKREDEMYDARKSEPKSRSASPRVDASRWSLDLLNALEWKRFERVCAGLFERLGFATQSAYVGADGGIDIRLFHGESKAPVAIVQCKAWKKLVGVDVVRELRGVMASEGIPEGIFATTTTFTKDAMTFAKANNIDLMDGRRILEAIDSLTEDQQSSLLQLATEGDYTTPTCASCGIKLLWRTPKSGARGFWGCSNYPRCKTTMYSAGST